MNIIQQKKGFWGLHDVVSHLDDNIVVYSYEYVGYVACVAVLLRLYIMYVRPTVFNGEFYIAVSWTLFIVFKQDYLI